MATPLLNVMTPAEIEREFGLGRGTVRKYLSQSEIPSGVARKADGRTWLISRKWATEKWGNK